MNATRPALRWHGGKWKLADWIISHFPEHKIYVEPFGGAASVLIKKPRSYAEIYNDLDGEVVNFFKVLRDQGDEPCRQVDLSPFARYEFNLSYEPSKDPLEQARRTVMRVFMGFGTNAHHRKTGFRSNSNRSGTTPAHDWTNYPKAMPVLIDRFAGVVIENRDAQEVMQAHDSPETLHYVDPPYLPETRDKGSDYKHEMSVQDHIELLEFLNSLKGMVVISGYASQLYDDHLPGWVISERQTHADGARKRTETIWANCSVLQSALNFQ